MKRVMEALSFTGRVLGMQQTAVNPPRAAAACAGFDGFGIFLPRLAQVDVHVDEAGRDDEAGGVENFRTVRAGNFSGRGDFGDGFSIEENVADRVGFGRGVEDAAVFNQSMADSLDFGVVTSSAGYGRARTTNWFRNRFRLCLRSGCSDGSERHLSR